MTRTMFSFPPTPPATTPTPRHAGSSRFRRTQCCPSQCRPVAAGTRSDFTRACPSSKIFLIKAKSRWSRTSAHWSRQSRAFNICPGRSPFLGSFSPTKISRSSGKRASPIGRSTKTGWGGRTGDLIQSLNGNTQVSLALSIAGTNTFEFGNQVIPYLISPDGSLGLNGFGGSTNAQIRLQGFKDCWRYRILAFRTSLRRHDDALDRSERSADHRAGRNRRRSRPFFPTTDLGRQLNMVAKLIAARDNLNMRRQIFFCAVGGYDTHGDRSNRIRNC